MQFERTKDEQHALLHYYNAECWYLSMHSSWHLFYIIQSFMRYVHHRWICSERVWKPSVSMRRLTWTHYIFDVVVIVIGFPITYLFMEFLPFYAQEFFHSVFLVCNSFITLLLAAVCLCTALQTNPLILIHTHSFTIQCNTRKKNQIFLSIYLFRWPFLRFLSLTGTLCYLWRVCYYYFCSETNVCVCVRVFVAAMVVTAANHKYPTVLRTSRILSTQT